MFLTTFVFLTIRAESAGDRQRFFKLIEEGNYGSIRRGVGTDKFVYQFLLDTHDNPDYVRKKLQEGGVHVLEVQNSKQEVVWRNKKYTTPFPAGNKTIKELRRSRRRRKVSAQ